MMPGASPKGAPERSPKAGAGGPSGVDGNGPKRFSVQRKMAIVARLLRGEPLELVVRETNVSIARLSEWRDRALTGAATALKERERDDRDDEIARLKAKVGEITMDTSCSTPRSRLWRASALWPTGGRDDEPRTLAFLCSLLWSGASCPGLERSRAPASIALSKRRRRLRSPVALVRSAHVRTRNWQIISAGK